MFLWTSKRDKSFHAIELLGYQHMMHPAWLLLLYILCEFLFNWNIMYQYLKILIVINLNYFSGSTNDLSLNTDGSAVNPGAFQQHIRRDSNLMGQLFQVSYVLFYHLLITFFIYQDLVYVHHMPFSLVIKYNFWTFLSISCLHVNLFNYFVFWFFSFVIGFIITFIMENTEWSRVGTSYFREWSE